MQQNALLRKDSFSMFMCAVLFWIHFSGLSITTSQILWASSTVRGLNMMEKDSSLDPLRKTISNKCTLIKNKTKIQVYLRAQFTLKTFLSKSHFPYKVFSSPIGIPHNDQVRDKPD